MSPVVATVATYSFIILLGALVGAMVVVFTERATRLVTFLAFAAGVMLGAAFFHMLPEAFHSGGYPSFTLVPAGFVFLVVLERYFLSHTCEEPLNCTEHAHHGLGLAALVGLSVHTLIDGLALGSAVNEGVGLMAFIAIVSHKVPSSLSLASILKSEGKSTSAILGYSTFYGLMVPVGAGLYFASNAALRIEKFSPWALAFSAGTFLYIAVSDLLPHVSRHGKERQGRNLVALFGGLLLMLALARFTEH
ncbi:ZIP family metal transporter [Hyalangium minutum]|uniref:Zinc transporter, ZIP family protein n=1 Tax=Hyalangium minutum TaxID=394096 RepID=A0A085W717_9BACT|nr:ZIP family metal transporter [Hyalangium minutum]KFE63480.1 Zinc transporter, ZIP family protein [Hyalangium minutum]